MEVETIAFANCKEDYLPVLVTHWSGTSAMLSSKVNDPVARGSTDMAHRSL